MCIQRLLQLSAADVYRFADSKQDADTLLESIRSLRETGVRIHLSNDSARMPYAWKL